MTSLSVSAISPMAKEHSAYGEATTSLRREISKGRGQLMSQPPHAYLVGEWGLTGICMGYSLACVDWVEKHGKGELPPLMAGRPDESIRHLEKLLTLAIYQSIEKGTDPEKLIRGPGNREVIDRIARTYEGLQKGRTGIAMVEKFPGPAFSDTAPAKKLVGNFRKICCDQRLTERDHFLFILSKEGEPVCHWHVIYVNPKLGIIGDAAGCLLWKIDEKAREFFPQVFEKFMKDEDYHKQDAVLVRLEKEPSSRCSVASPLIMSRIYRRGQTALNIARHSGPGAGAKYLWTIHSNSLVGNGIRLFEKPMNRALEACIAKRRVLRDLKRIMTLHFISDVSFDYIRGHLKEIAQFNNDELDELNDMLCISIGELKDPKKADDVLRVLEKIQGLGPDAHRLSSYLQQNLFKLCQFVEGYHEHIEHILKSFVPGLLKLRKKSEGVKFPLEPFLTLHVPEVWHIPYYKLLIEAGANPCCGPTGKRKNDLSPIDSAIWWKRDKVVEFFASYGAKPSPKRTKSKGKS